MTGKIAIVVSAVFLSACAGVNPYVIGDLMTLPDQSLSAKPPPGQQRILFFNSTNRLLSLATHKLVITLNDQVSPPIPANSFLQFFLEPGSYDILLTRWDGVHFSEPYALVVADEPVYAQWHIKHIVPILGIKKQVIEQVDSLPAEFEKNFISALDAKTNVKLDACQKCRH